MLEHYKNNCIYLFLQLITIFNLRG